MIDLIAIRDYIKAFAQAHSYIQHNEAVRAYNRFVTYDFDESNTGDTGATAFPRLSLVANSRFGGYNGKMEQQGGQPLKATMQMEVSVVNTYPEGNYRRHDEVSNETLKVLTDLVSYLHANQKAQKCHPVLQHINFNSFQFFKTKLQTHGNAIGWALSFELGARIDSDFSGSMPPPLPMPPTPVGSLFYWNGTQYAPLPPAAAGSVLKSQGLNTPPAWEQGTETDPIFTNWLSTVARVNDWNAAFAWGNHADAGYLTSLPAHNHDDRYYTMAEIDVFLNFKEDKIIQRTGASIAFDAPANYGTRTTPSSGNITGNYIGARIGVTQLLIHAQGTVPTIPATWVKMSGSIAYDTAKTNFIIIEWQNSNVAIYSIIGNE